MPATLRATLLPALVVALAATLLPAGTATAQAPRTVTDDEPSLRPGGRTVTYEYCVRTRGVPEGARTGFADTARQILAATGGWSLGGTVRFRQRDGCDGTDLTLWLASPAAVAGFAAVCDPRWSCRTGRDVVINRRRWRDATPSWHRSEGSLRDYRRMVIYHEVGHRLGFGHAGCPAAGAPAPVMMQQSIDLAGCRHNPQPTPAERRRLAERLGVRILPPLSSGDAVRVAGSPTVHLVARDRLRPVPNLATLRERHPSGFVRVVARRDVADMPRGRPVPDVTAPDTADGMLVSAPSSPTIHLMRSALRRPVASADAFRGHGFFWGDVRTVADLSRIPQGLPLPAPDAPVTAEGTLLQADGPAVWAVEDGRRRLVPSRCSFGDHGLRWRDVRDVSAGRLRDIPAGEPLARC